MTKASLLWRDLKDKLLKALDDQGISTGPLWYKFTERLGDTKATFNQAALDIGIRTVSANKRVMCIDI